MKALYLIIAAVILAAVQLPDSAAFNMRLTVSGSGYVTSGSPSFITCDGICNAIYVPPGAEITLTATPYGNSQFAGWGGACSGTDQRCTLVMNNDREITATFSGQAVAEYQLTVYRNGNGKGTIQSNPSGIFVGSTFSYDYSKFAGGSAVEITATPDSSSKFVAWSGDCTGTSPTCTVMMNSQKSVTATISLSNQEPVTSTLKVEKLGRGVVSSSDNKINCGTSCSATFNQGDSVRLTATADSGNKFSGWSGACSGSSPTCTVTMGGLKTVTASFESTVVKPQPLKTVLDLTVNVNDHALGYVSSSDGKIVCGVRCVGEYKKGDLVTLKAEGARGNSLARWGGACSGSSSTCTIIMTSDTTVDAMFGPDPTVINLTIKRIGKGGGRVASYDGKIYCGDGGEKCSAIYNKDDRVKLEALTNLGSAWGGWGGDCFGGHYNCDLIMNESKTVLVTFFGNSMLSVNASGMGKVTSTDGKIDCSDCIVEYPFREKVTVNAVPSEGAVGTVFDSWTGAGCDSVTKPSCTILLDKEEMSVTAKFARTSKNIGMLTISKTGTGTGNVVSRDEKINCGKICTASYYKGENLMIEAYTEDSSLVWGGACSGTFGNICFLNMDTSKTAIAEFTKIDKRPTAGFIISSVGPGNQYVTSTDGRINCTACDDNSYREGDTVTLMAHVPSELWEFESWNAPCHSSVKEPKCTVTAIYPFLDIQANFKPIESFRYTLTVEKKGAGKGRIESSDGQINCGDACTAKIVPSKVDSTRFKTQPSTLTLTYYPEEHSTIESYEGCEPIQSFAATARNSCTIKMDSDKKVIANIDFIKKIMGAYIHGPGTVASTPPGIDCASSNNCFTQSFKFKEDENVTLKAVPDDGAVFLGWRGMCSGKQPTCTLLPGSQNIGAIFSYTPVLTVNNKFGGVVKGSTVPATPYKINCGEKSSKKETDKDCRIDYKEPGFIAKLELEPKQFNAKWKGCHNTDVWTGCYVIMGRSYTAEVYMDESDEKALVRQALWELFGGSNPSLDDYIKNDDNPPSKKTLKDLQDGGVSHDVNEIKAWIANNRQWYLNEGGIQKVIDEWQKGAVKDVLREVFSSELSQYPTLIAYLTDENQKPFQYALNDMKAGREGGGRDGLKRWLMQNKEWYLWAAGITAEIERIKQAQLEAEIAVNKPVINSISPDNGRLGGRPLIAGKFKDVLYVTLNGNQVPTIVSDNKIIIGEVRWGRDSYGVEIGVPGIVEVHTKWGSTSSKLISPSGPIYYNAVGEKEGCFPGVGSGCMTSGPLWLSLRKTLGKPIGCDPQPDGSFKCSIAAGSIEHDNCCLRFPQGKWCGGPGIDGQGKAEETNHDGHCATEWNHAFWDVFWERAWTEQYRPDQQFDLTPSGGSRNNAYVIGEAVSSLSYCAKSGHEMREAEHAPFCCSGQVDRNKKCT